MRKEFSAWLEDRSKTDDQVIFMTGDLGFNAFERVQELLGRRFVNAAVSEQNMISMAAALAQQGLKPICYSIAPFAVFRPAEQIRVDVCLHDLNVKIVGNGGGYGYGIMGATHHAIEDIAVLSSFQNMLCYVPFCNEQVASICDQMMKVSGPAYLRMGAGTLLEGIRLGPFEALQKVKSGQHITVVGLGPVLLNAIRAAMDRRIDVDVFAVNEISQLNLTDEFRESINRTKTLFIVEEHVSRGGIAERIALLAWKDGLEIKRFTHHCATGYPSKMYGSQGYHQRENALDSHSIGQALEEMIL